MELDVGVFAMAALLSGLSTLCVRCLGFDLVALLERWRLVLVAILLVAAAVTWVATRDPAATAAFGSRAGDVLLAWLPELVVGAIVGAVGAPLFNWLWKAVSRM